MPDSPQFTIITSTLNSGATLERCLRSVAGQSYASFEHLIADGTSSDDTLAIVERFSPVYPLRLACSAPDTGLYQAWNRALDQTRGQWILFLGSDDFLISGDILSSVAEALVADSSLLASRFLYCDTVSAEERTEWAIYQPHNWLYWLRGVTNFPTSVFINAQLFQQGHRFDESYRICADHKFFAEHDLFGHGTYLPIPIISFQQGGISSDSNFELMHYLERRRMLGELNRSRPWFTEWYYWLRSHKALLRAT
ncbi:MAG: hypothetical protein RLZZ206_1104 [Cyanobacteriota bacterium]|jgi:glycosyltransferase involved in cell wall biosynthesis